MSAKPYPSPRETGGQLIRLVNAALKSAVEMPVTSHILIATSGGPDSTALAHLVVRYGRRIAQRERISLLHINHGWRGEASEGDQRLVEEQGRRWGVPVIVHRVTPPAADSGASWEEHARSQRQAIFAEEVKARDAWILTAHHGDDLAETLLWRLFSGTAKTHGGGIAQRDGRVLRPLLRARKAQLEAYLREESEEFRQDSTNLDQRFLRARMRLELMPAVEAIFPRAVEHLIELGLEAQKDPGEAGVDPGILFRAAGLKIRAAHWKALKGLAEGGRRELDLPEGWRLRSNADPERWILEKGRKV